VVSPVAIPHAPEVASGICTSSVLRMSRTVDISSFRKEGKVGCLFAAHNHLAHSRQFQRRKEKSRLAENVARFAEVHSNPFLAR